MTVENMQSRAAWNGDSTNLRQSPFPTIYTPKNHIFGYMTDGLGAVSGTDGKVLNLEGTNVLLSCMHAWGNESDQTPADIVESISVFTGRTQRDYAVDEGFGHYHPNVALQCTDVHDGGDGNMYATFKVVTSMLAVGGVRYASNYQCAFSTISIVYPSAPKNGYLKIHTVSGKLMVKETGEPLTIDGKEVTAEKTFVAEEADGSIILEFTFDSSALAGKKIVAFEDVTYEGISIGTHEDLTDEDQTISYPEIHTTAADQASGSKTMTLGSSVTLVDTVTYKGLTAGKTYVVKGTIMDKASGETIGVTAETTFTAEAADGSVEVTFTFDTTQLQGKTLVVFETLYDTQGNPIVAHSDLNDEDQTVSVPVQPVIPPVVTGDDSSPMPYVFGLAVAVLIAMAAVVILLRKRKNQK